MYYPHFGIKEAPFKITPNTEFFFEGGNRGAVLDALIYAIEEGEGIIKVVGEVGSGKTMICRMLQDTLHEDIEIVYLAIPSVEPEHVLHAIAFELQLKIPRNADRLKVMHLLQDYLLKRHSKGLQTVIFVEEAQAMPIATLEEIRLLSNLETNQDKLLQIVLFGQPELDINLNELDIRQLRDRITHSFSLGPLEADEVGEYLSFRLRAAGYDGPQLFKGKTIKKIAQASDGLIRRVNILADKSLLSAFSENSYQVTPKHVAAAIKDSEFGTKAPNYRLYFMIASLLIVALLGLLAFISMQPTQRLTSAPASGTIEKSAVKVTETTNEKSAANDTNDPSEIEAASTTPKSFNINHQLSLTASTFNKLPKDTYTIQVMTASNDHDLKKEIDSLSHSLDISQVYAYRMKSKGADFTIILYGHYADRSSALAVLRALPTQFKDKNPYLRNIGKVLREMQ